MSKSNIFSLQLLPLLASALEFGSAAAPALTALLKMGSWLSTDEFSVKVELFFLLFLFLFPEFKFLFLPAMCHVFFLVFSFCFNLYFEPWASIIGTAYNYKTFCLQ